MSDDSTEFAFLIIVAHMKNRLFGELIDRPPETLYEKLARIFIPVLTFALALLSSPV